MEQLFKHFKASLLFLQNIETETDAGIKGLTNLPQTLSDSPFVKISTEEALELQGLKFTRLQKGTLSSKRDIQPCGFIAPNDVRFDSPQQVEQEYKTELATILQELGLI